jgi:ligand-binding sensor domain-containing protein/two-component sensor histidine kinase
MRRWPGVFIALVCGAAVSAHAERLPLKGYTTADGLPHNEISCIVRDSRGFLWLCTGDGLSRFDGATFVSYGTAQGLPTPRVTDLLQTRDGRYFVATDGGLVRFDPMGSVGGSDALFPAVPAADAGDHPLKVTALLEDRDGGIWCGTDRGLYRVAQAGTPKVVPVDVGLQHDNREQQYITDLVQDRTGSIWIATPSGLYRRWPDGRTARYTVRDGLPDDHLEDLLIDRTGRLWGASRFDGFFRIDADASRRPPTVSEHRSTAEGLPAAWIFRLFEGTDGRFWAATNRGVIEWRAAPRPGMAFKAYDVASGLAFPAITALGEDSAGNLWMGTSASGAMKLARNGLLTYAAAEGLATVNALFEDESGDVCLRGTVQPALVRGRATPPPYAMRMPIQFACFDGRAFHAFVPDAIGNFPRIGWVLEDVTLRSGSGEWWLGTGNGVYRFPRMRRFRDLAHASPLAHYTVRDGLAAPQVFRLFEDAAGGVWVSTVGSSTNGLARWDRSTGRWRNFAGAAGLPSLQTHLPRAFGEAPEGTVWIGFADGLARVRGGQVRFFTVRDGLPPGAIAALHTDAAGRLWIASSRSGVIRLDRPDRDEPTFDSYTAARGLSSNTAVILADDAFHRVYIGTSRGLDRLEPATGRMEHFTTADGLAPGLFRAALRDHQGTIWFGMTGGLSRFTPTASRPEPPPPVLISGVSVGGARVPMSVLGQRTVALPDLRPAQNQILIQFAGFDFAPGARLRYEYELDSASDGAWSLPSEQASVNFGRLAAGVYRFHVRAVTTDGRVSNQPATVNFTILRPVWQRWWFMGLGLLAIGGVAIAAHRSRVGRAVELANVRTRIATDLHDDVGSNLTAIAILTEVARREIPAGLAGAEAPLSSIARISRESLADMSDIVWAINPRHDHLGDLVRRMRRTSEELCATRGVALAFDAPADPGPEIGADLRRDLFLIFKEAMHNAVRHAGCRTIAVTLQAKRHALSLEVRDDGSGFVPERAVDGEGLAAMRLRAARCGGTCHISSSPGSGTLVRVRIPRSGRRSLRSPVGDDRRRPDVGFPRE